MTDTIRYKARPEDEGTIIYPDKAEKDKYTLNASRRYREEWRNANKTRVSMRLLIDGEEDVIKKLDHVSNKTDYIRTLIEKDIAE